MANKVMTLDEIKLSFEARGETISDWALQHGFPKDAVYAVLNGRSRCKRGRGHQIAIALGLKIQTPDVTDQLEADAEA